MDHGRIRTSSENSKSMLATTGVGWLVDGWCIIVKLAWSDPRVDGEIEVGWGERFVHHLQLAGNGRSGEAIGLIGQLYTPNTIQKQQRAESSKAMFEKLHPSHQQVDRRHVIRSTYMTRLIQSKFTIQGRKPGVHAMLLLGSIQADHSPLTRMQ